MWFVEYNIEPCLKPSSWSNKVPRNIKSRQAKGCSVLGTLQACLRESKKALILISPPESGRVRPLEFQTKQSVKYPFLASALLACGEDGNHM